MFGSSHFSNGNLQGVCEWFVLERWINNTSTEPEVFCREQARARGKTKRGTLCVYLGKYVFTDKSLWFFSFAPCFLSLSGIPASYSVVFLSHTGKLETIFKTSCMKFNIIIYSNTAVGDLNKSLSILGFRRRQVAKSPCEKQLPNIRVEGNCNENHLI